MPALRRIGFMSALVVLGSAGCDRNQPLEPSTQPSSRTAPPPSNISAGAVSESRIDVSWQDNSHSETGFELHRSTDGPTGTFALLASTGAGVTSHSDVGLSATTQYCYRARAFQTAGSKTRYSPFSSTACETTPAPPPPPSPPAAPTLRAADTHPFQILLWWFEDSDEDGFKVERCVGVVCGDSDFAVIAAFATSGTRDHFFQDFDVVPGTTYTYRVRGFNGAGDSAPSNQRSATACFVEESEDGYYFCSGF